MGHFPHQLYLVLERLLPLVARVLLLFRKCFHSHHSVVSQPLGQIHCSEGSFANFSLGLEKFVEVPLVDFLFELESPHVDD